MTLASTTFEQVAVHEAAHAVAALQLGLDVITVKLHAEGGTTTVRDPGPRDLAHAERSIIWTLAPRAASDELAARSTGRGDEVVASWFLPQRPWDEAYQADWPGNEDTDDAKALADARAVTDTEAQAQALVRRCQREAVAVARTSLFVAALKAVAAELLSKRQIRGDRIAEVLLATELQIRAARLAEIGGSRPASRRPIARQVETRDGPTVRVKYGFPSRSEGGRQHDSRSGPEPWLHGS